jgi:hypothetical protein
MTVAEWLIKWAARLPERDAEWGTELEAIATDEE